MEENDGEIRKREGENNQERGNFVIGLGYFSKMGNWPLWKGERKDAKAREGEGRRGKWKGMGRERERRGGK